jgi:hypothetical protein
MPEDQNNAQQNSTATPGTVFNPGAQQPVQQNNPVAPAALPVEPLPAAPQQKDVSNEPEASVPTYQEEPAYPESVSDVSPSKVSWTASEFISHEKSASWYLGLAALAIVSSSLVFILTKGIISSVVIIAAAIVFAVYAEHKPRQLLYQLDNIGLSIGGRMYAYEEFRCFSVIPEGGVFAINFMPLKRFSPVLTIYFAPDDEKKIMDVLVNQLPYEEPRRDAVDSLMTRIRF